MDPILGSSSVWVTPQARDLLQGSLINCYVPGCKSTFKNSGNLQMHLDKHHKIPAPTKKEPVCPKLYFCPQPDCMYNAKSATKKHFKSLKYLRQHFQKVHAEKIFKCSKCSKSFGTASMRDFHVRNCGKEFSCNVCEWTYDSSEALLTHAKRKGHKLNRNSDGKVAIPRLRNKSLASIVLEVTNCVASDENPDGVVVVESGDYGDVLEIPKVLHATNEVSSAVKGASDVATSDSCRNLNPPYNEAVSRSPSRPSHPVETSSFHGIPDLREAAKNSESPADGVKNSAPVQQSVSVDMKDFRQSVDTSTSMVPVNYSVVLRTLPHSTESSNYSSHTLKPSLHPSAPLETTIYCSAPESVDPTSYSRCLETPRHCPDPDDDSNYSRDLETPPCIDADREHFSASSPPADKPPSVNFTQPARISSCASNCIETQTESDPICIALPPKKRLKVATTPPLNHFTEPPFCDIETQTEFDLRTGPGDPMLYTDMHTQTCHEFLTELGLSDIQTQTNWSANDMDDGIQLSSTQSKRFSSGAYDELMVSTETQTSSTQCLLESCNEEDSLSGCITQHTQTCDFLLEGLFGGGNNDFIGGFQSSLRLDCFRAENNDR